MRPTGVLAVGASAGGPEALMELVAGLPADLPATVLVTVHIGEQAVSRLPRILARSGPLPASHARHGEELRAGHVHVAPPGHHLLCAGGEGAAVDGPRVNRHRPAVDVMFASAARWAGPRTVAAVLSGALDDGAVGAALVARAGGAVVVQDPAGALVDSMPLAAAAAAPAAAVVPTAELGAALAGRAAALPQHPLPQDATTGEETAVHMDETDDPHHTTPEETRLTRLSCPECQGVLAEVALPHVTYYRCHVGHQYAPQALEAAQRESAQARLWAAVAALEEHAAAMRDLAGQRPGELGRTLRDRAERSAGPAQSVRTTLHGRP